MGAGLPVEGERGPYAGDAVTPVATCAPDEQAADVAERADGRVVVVAGRGLAVGEVDAAKLRSAPDGAAVLDVMDLIPDTIRPSVPLEDVDEGTDGRLVTTSEGIVLGALDLGAR